MSFTDGREENSDEAQLLQNSSFSTCIDNSRFTSLQTTVNEVEKIIDSMDWSRKLSDDISLHEFNFGAAYNDLSRDIDKKSNGIAKAKHHDYLRSIKQGFDNLLNQAKKRETKMSERMIGNSRMISTGLHPEEEDERKRLFIQDLEELNKGKFEDMEIISERVEDSNIIFRELESLVRNQQSYLEELNDGMTTVRQDTSLAQDQLQIAKHSVIERRKNILIVMFSVGLIAFILAGVLIDPLMHVIIWVPSTIAGFVTGSGGVLSRWNSQIHSTMTNLRGDQQMAGPILAAPVVARPMTHVDGTIVNETVINNEEELASIEKELDGEPQKDE